MQSFRLISVEVTREATYYLNLNPIYFTWNERAWGGGLGRGTWYLSKLVLGKVFTKIYEQRYR